MDIATKDQFLSKKTENFIFDPQKYCSKYLDFHVKTQLFLVKKIVNFWTWNWFLPQYETWKQILVTMLNSWMQCICMFEKNFKAVKKWGF